MLLTISFIIVSLLALALVAYLTHTVRSLSENLAELSSHVSTIDNKIGTINDEGKLLGLLNKAATHAKNCSTILLEHTKSGIDTINSQLSVIGKDLKEGVMPAIDRIDGCLGETREAVITIRDLIEWEDKIVGIGYPGCTEEEFHDGMIDGAKIWVQYAMEAEKIYRELNGREETQRSDERTAPDDGHTAAIKDEPADEEGATTANR